MSRQLSLIPLLLVPILLVALGRGDVAVPPFWWVAPVAVLTFGVVVTLPPRSRLLDLTVVVALGLMAGNLFFAPGFPRGHDITNHLWGIWGFYKAILDGDLYPRWLHHLGMGMPLIEFYPPGSFYLLLPFLPFKLPPHDALKAGFILYSVLAGMGMYEVVRRWTSDRVGGLVAALAYMFSPYMLLDSHYRVALAEAAAFVMVPWFFYYGIAAVREPSRQSIAKASLAAALLILIHPLSASMCVTGITLWLTVEFWPFRHGFRVWGRKLAAYFVLGVLALGMAGFYVVPLAAQSKNTTITRSLGGGKSGPLFTGYGLYPWQWVDPRRWTGWQKSERAGSENDKKGKEMPYYVGLTWVALIPLGAGWWQVRRRREESKPVVVGEGDTSTPMQSGEESPPVPAKAPLFAPAGLVAVALSGLILSMRPLDMVLGWIPNFTMLQFPFRLLSLFTFGAAAIAGYAVLRLKEVLAEEGRGATLIRLAPALVGALMIVDAFPYTGAPMWGADYQGVADQVGGGKRCEEGSDCARSREITQRPIPLRAEGTFFFPPADYAMDLGLIKHVYPEYFSPEVRRNFLDKLKGETQDPTLAEAAVGWSFNGKGPKPRMIEAQPYAEFRKEGWKEGDPVVPLEYVRKGGEIRVTKPALKGQVVVREQDFPGWTVETDIGWRDVNATKEGLIQVRLDETWTMAHFVYSDWTGDRFVGVLLTLISLIVAFFPKRMQSA